MKFINDRRNFGFLERGFLCGALSVLNLLCTSGWCWTHRGVHVFCWQMLTLNVWATNTPGNFFNIWFIAVSYVVNIYTEILFWSFKDNVFCHTKKSILYSVYSIRYNFKGKAEGQLIICSNLCRLIFVVFVPLIGYYKDFPSDNDILLIKYVY